MSSTRSVHSERRMKKDPRLKPAQSCGMSMLIESVSLSPVGEEETTSRKGTDGGWMILRGL